MQPQPQSPVDFCSFKQSCLFVCGNTNLNIKPNSRPTDQASHGYREQSNKGKIVFRPTYLNLLTFSCTGKIGKGLKNTAVGVKMGCLPRENDLSQCCMQ